MADRDMERLAHRMAAQEAQVEGLMRTQQVARTVVGGVAVEDALAQAGDTADRVDGLGGDVSRLDDGTALEAWDAAQRVPVADDYLDDLSQRVEHDGDLLGSVDAWREERQAMDEHDAIDWDGIRADVDQAGRDIVETREELDGKLADLDSDLEAADGRITAAQERADAAFGKAETAEGVAGDATTTAGTALSTATGAATAASDAQGTADTARQEATDKAAAAEAAAKTYAEAQAAAAQSAAEATAAADALAKANVARDDAVGTAAADATTKAADALAAAEADATAKADAARAAAELAAAADALAKADAAEAAAKAVANTAQSRADAAHALAGTAEGNAQAALTMAGTKARVTYSTSAPSGSASAGDLHRRFPTAAEIAAGASQGDIMQEWRSLGGASWQETKVSSQAIANLDVGKLTVQSGVISDLVAQHIAGRTAAFQEVDVANLFVTGEAAIRQAVINKLYADVVKAKLLTVTEKIIANDIFAAGVVGAAALSTDALDFKTARGLSLVAGDISGSTLRLTSLGSVKKANCASTSGWSSTGGAVSVQAATGDDPVRVSAPVGVITVPVPSLALPADSSIAVVMEARFLKGSGQATGAWIQMSVAGLPQSAAKFIKADQWESVDLESYTMQAANVSQVKVTVSPDKPGSGARIEFAKLTLGIVSQAAGSVTVSRDDSGKAFVDVDGNLFLSRRSGNLHFQGSISMQDRLEIKSWSTIALLSRTETLGNVFALKSQLNAWSPIDGTHAWVTSEGREYVRAGGAWKVGYEDTPWVHASPDTGTGTISWKCTNRLVEVRWNGTGTFPVGATTLKTGHIPPSYRPDRNIRGTGALNANAGALLYVSGAGTIGLINSTGASRTGGEGQAFYHL